MIEAVITEDPQLQKLADWIAESQAGPRIEVSFAGDSALALVRLVQLAARHPDITDTMRAIAHEFVNKILDQCPPAIAEIMDAGWESEVES